MKRIRKFLRIHRTDRRLLVKSVFLVGFIRLGLWLLPLQTLRRLLARIARASPELQEADAAVIDRAAWAVKVASRYMPKATCLTQALAVQMLLSRRGYPVHLRIGVAKGERGQLEAHAWVESQERIVIGGLVDLSRYTPLPPLEGESNFL